MTDRKYKGKGYVEFLANREEIRRLADKGYSITLIFNELSDNKKITIKYGQFYNLFRRSDIKIRKVDAKKLGTGIGIKKEESKKENKEPLKRQTTQQSSKLTFENNPSKHNRHF